MTLRTILLHRLPGIIPLLFLTSVLSFGLVQLSPSDPAEVALRLNDITPTPEVIAETRARLGLDQPLPLRYFRWLDAVLHGDLGTSYVNGKAVTAELRQALPPTAMLAATAAVPTGLRVCSCFSPPPCLLSGLGCCSCKFLP